jgi:hypothetical protein
VKHRVAGVVYWWSVVRPEEVGTRMATFTFYIHDDRYRVPSLAIVDANDEGRARILAADRLLESTHHTAVDVYEGEELRFSVTPGPRASDSMTTRCALFRAPA